jgi:hypothetical protein
MVEWTMKNKLERMRNHTVVTEFELWHEKNHEDNHNNLSSAWDKNPGPRK